MIIGKIFNKRPIIRFLNSYDRLIHYIGDAEFTRITNISLIWDVCNTNMNVLIILTQNCIKIFLDKFSITKDCNY